MTRYVFAALLAACAPVAPVGGAGDSGATAATSADPTGGTAAPIDRCAGEIRTCIDLDTVEDRWFVPGGAVTGTLVADLDGDGLTELLVAVVVGGKGLYARVDLPPKGRTDVLAVTDWILEPLGLSGPWEATGDGVPDLLAGIAWDRNTVLMMEGPLVPGTEEVVELPVAGVWFADVNGDGITDVMRQPADKATIEIVHGPSDRWTGPADLVVAASCGLGYDDVIWFDPGELRLVPDATGDGFPEFLMMPNPKGSTCALPYRLFPANLVGVIDPQTDPRAVSVFPTYVGDQNGDDLADFNVAGQVVAGPLVVSEDGLVTSPVLLDSTIYGYLLTVDMDGDGSDDFSTGELYDQAQPPGGSRTGFEALHDGQMVPVGPLVVTGMSTSMPLAFTVGDQSYLSYQDGYCGSTEVVVIPVTP